MLWRMPRQPADTRLSGVLGEICFWLSAPFRLARRLLPGRPAADVAGIRAPAAGPMAKELARRVFHRGMRRLLHMPGGRQASRLLRAVAPGPVEFLALRYRAYEQRAAAGSTVAVFVSAEVVLFDLSDDEARLYRQFAARGLAAAATPEGSDPMPARNAS